MNDPTFTLRDLPRYENICAQAQRYPDIEPLSVATCLLLLRVSSDLLRALEDYLQPRGLSQGRFTVLMLLNRNPDTPLCPAALADKAGVTRATMTGLLDGLQREGLIARHGVPEDRRMLWISLTPKARSFLDDILPEYFRRVRAAMAPLADDQKLTLARLLSRLDAGLESLAPPPNNPASRSPDTLTNT